MRTNLTRRYINMTPSPHTPPQHLKKFNSVHAWGRMFRPKSSFGLYMMVTNVPSIISMMMGLHQGLGSRNLGVQNNGGPAMYIGGCVVSIININLWLQRTYSGLSKLQYQPYTDGGECFVQKLIRPTYDGNQCAIHNLSDGGVYIRVWAQETWEFKTMVDLICVQVDVWYQ